MEAMAAVIGKIVYDYALGKSGIVVGGPFTEACNDKYNTLPIDWEWCVLYADGELAGADDGDIQEVTNESG
jgi:hypothetical protein